MVETKVIVLQQGYCKANNDASTFEADCSVSLILGNFSPILVDTSGPCNGKKLVSNINEVGYKCEDIATVVCTHGHSDHVGNLNLFPHSKFIVGFDVFHDNIYESFDFKSENAIYPLNDDVYVIATPGHTNADVSVVVDNTNCGTVVVAGDIFENENDMEDSSMWQSLSENVEMQEKSRNRIISLADYIIPGHGKMFQVTKEMKTNSWLLR